MNAPPRHHTLEEAGTHPYTRGLAALRVPCAGSRAGGEKREWKRGGKDGRDLKEKEEEREEVPKEVRAPRTNSIYYTQTS